MVICILELIGFEPMTGCFKDNCLKPLGDSSNALTGVEPATMDYETTELPFTPQCEMGFDRK